MRFSGRLMNIHPSLLPLYPGLHTHQRALDNGDSHAGATVHYVTGELDGGPPVLQARYPLIPGMTPIHWQHGCWKWSIVFFQWP